MPPKELIAIEKAFVDRTAYERGESKRSTSYVFDQRLGDVRVKEVPNKRRRLVRSNGFSDLFSYRYHARGLAF